MKHLTSLGVVLGTALLTALLAAPVLSPAALRAEGEAQDEATEALELLTAFAPSTLPADSAGLVVDVKLDRESYEAGQKPVLTLTATNKKSGARKEKVVVRMHAQEPTDFLSRSMPMPTEILSKELNIDLDGEACEKLDIETGYVVQPGKLVTISVQVGDQTFTGASFGAPAAAVPPTQAPAPPAEEVAGK